MTPLEKNRINALRAEGMGYKRISALTGLSADTVKSYCKRNPIDTNAALSLCEQCGAPISLTPHRKKKRFCSDKCRLAWWNAHAELVQRSTHDAICLCCGNTFQSERSGRKFCSRACYADYRRKEKV